MVIKFHGGAKTALRVYKVELFVPDKVDEPLYSPKDVCRIHVHDVRLTTPCQRKLALRNTYDAFKRLNTVWFGWSLTKPEGVEKLPDNWKIGLDNGNAIFSPLGIELKA